MEWLNELLLFLCYLAVAGFRFSGPGCCCDEEEGCEFFSDSFTRADNDNPGSYTEVSGDWDISSNTLVTSSSNGVLIADVEHPDAEPNIRVSVTVNIPSSSNARIILDYVDADNYWFVEAPASGGVNIYQRSGGSNTLKATGGGGDSAGFDRTLCASIINGSRITAHRLAPAAVISSVSFDASFSSPKVGLGTGSVSGTVTFDGLTLSRTNATCPQCAGYCSTCGPDIIQNFAKISFVDLTGGSGGCCSGFNGTYYAPMVSTCVWQLKWFSDFICAETTGGPNTPFEEIDLRNPGVSGGSVSANFQNADGTFNSTKWNYITPDILPCDADEYDGGEPAIGQSFCIGMDSKVIVSFVEASA